MPGGASKSKAELAYARAQWLLTEPGEGAVLDFTLRRDAHSIASSPLDRLPPEIIARRNAVILDLRQTQVADITLLSEFAELEVVRLDGTNISEISALANSVRIRELSLSRTKITNLSTLANFPDLQELFVIGTPIEDLRPLAGLKKLKTLWASNTGIKSLDGIAQLTELELLWLDNTKVTDLSPLAGLTKLRQLRLSNTPVGNLSPIANIVRLVEASETSRSTSETFGVEFAGCPIDEHTVRELSFLRNPERTRRVVNHYRSLAGLPPVGNWQSDFAVAGADPTSKEVPTQTDNAVKFIPDSEGLIDIAPPTATDREVEVLRAEVIRKARSLADKCSEGSNDDTADIRHSCKLVVSLLQAGEGTSEASAAAIWSYGNSLRSKLRADTRRQRLSANERELMLEDPPLLIGLSEDLGDLVQTIERFAVADKDLGIVERGEPSHEEQSAAARALDGGGRSLAKAAVDHASLLTKRASDVLHPIAAGEMRASGTTGSKKEVVEVDTINNFIIVAVNEALPLAQERLENKPETDATKALKTIAGSLEKSSRPKSVLDVAKTGAGRALGAAAVSRGEAALTWVVQHADKILAVVSANPAFKIIVQAVQWLMRLFAG